MQITTGANLLGHRPRHQRGSVTARAAGAPTITRHLDERRWPAAPAALFAPSSGHASSTGALALGGSRDGAAWAPRSRPIARPRGRIRLDHRCRVGRSRLHRLVRTHRPARCSPWRHCLGSPPARSRCARVRAAQKPPGCGASPDERALGVGRSSASASRRCAAPGQGRPMEPAFDLASRPFAVRPTNTIRQRPETADQRARRRPVRARRAQGTALRSRRTSTKRWPTTSPPHDDRPPTPPTTCRDTFAVARSTVPLLNDEDAGADVADAKLRALLAGASR